MREMIEIHSFIPHPVLSFCKGEVFFFSSSALFAGALNAVNHVLIPALGPVLMNIVYISTLLLCLYFGLSIYALCAGILFGGFAQFVLHAITYFRYNFSFGVIDSESVQAFKQIMRKFLPSLFGVSIIEINLFVDTIIASFLPQGSVSLLHYSGRFMNIPIGIFAVGFATVLLPQFSRYATYAPKRLSYYVLEVTKFVTWIIVPASFFLMFVSESIFSTVMLGKKATMHDVWMAKWILIIYVSGLVFACLNKILVNAFYSLHDTKTPTVALVISTIVNFVCNVIGMKLWGAFGIAGSTSISAAVLTLFLFLFLKTKHKFRFYSGNYLNFLGKYLLQILIAVSIFAISYLTFLQLWHGTSWYYFFASGWGFWLFVVPLGVLVGLFLFLTKKLFGIKLYFLSK